jgi:hypothetical protein
VKTASFICFIYNLVFKQGKIMPGNTEAILYDVNGDPLAVDDGVAIPAGTPLIISGGSDGTNSRYIKVDSSGNQILVGLGIAGTPAGGVITIQGDPAGTPIPISGNITASNASVGLNDTAIPGSSTLIAGSDGTNLRSLRVFDADTGGGTQWILGVGLRKFAGGGSVEFGTSSDPIRTDPTGTTTQPISGTITANQGGSWTVAGTGNFTVVQATASNLRAQLASEAATGTAVPSTAVQMGGSDGVNLRPFFTDSSGRQIVIGSAANGAAVTGNPVLVAGSDGTNARSIRTATDGTVRVDPTGTTTQPISGTVTANAGSGTFTVAGTVAATQSGTWTVQPGNTANTTPWLTTISQGGNSATVTASNALKIDGSAVTQPVSGTITSNQGTAAALSGKWPVQITDGTNTMPTGDVVGRAIFHKITDGTNTAAVKAPSTAAASTDPALVVALSPNSSTIVVTTSNLASSTIELSYDDSVAVAGAQAGYFYNGIVYTIPTSYTFNCVQFNSSSADNRVTTRVSKFITAGNYNLGTNIFTSGSSYTTPNFGSYLEAEVTTVIGGTNDVTLTATYTNQDGTSGRTATAFIKKNTPVNYKTAFTLQSGDYGVLSVQNITRSTANTGVFAIKIGIVFFLQIMNVATSNYILATATQSLIAKSGEFVELSWSSNAAATSERIIKVLGTITPNI